MSKTTLGTGGATASGSGGGVGGTTSALFGSTTNSTDGVGGFTFGSDAGDDAQGCQHLAVQFVPKIPLVYVLADRSGSVFSPITASDGTTTSTWASLKTATLTVVQNLQTQVAFGFGAYTGINPNTQAGMCPILDEVPIALNNYTAIQTKYNALGQPGFKAETPAALSLAKAGTALDQAASMLGDAGAAGGKFVLWVTDAETDFCDDGACICPADAVIAAVQQLYKKGIQTLILGLPSGICGMAADKTLQSLANAGAGLPALAPPLNANDPPATPTTIWQQCNPRTGWNDLLKAAGLPMNSALGTYATATTMDAPLFKPDPKNVSDLTNKLSTALNTVKSCSFDLQGKIQVKLASANLGHVSVDGVAIPYDMTNGWTMSSSTQLDLVGTACDNWRSKGMDISFDFPCDILIPPPQ